MGLATPLGSAYHPHFFKMPSDPENLPNYHISCQNVKNRKALICKNLSLTIKGIGNTSFQMLFDFTSVVPLREFQD
jgi:hypothetical protein